VTRRPARIYETLVRNVERGDAIIVTVRDLVGRAGGDRRFPNLPVIGGNLLPREQDSLAVERYIGISGREEVRSKWFGCGTGLDEHGRALGKAIDAFEPCKWFIARRGSVEQRRGLRLVRRPALRHEKRRAED
jgi:hypothetical protein